MNNEVSDQIIAQAQAGNAAAVTAIYERYRQRIYRFLYYRLGHQQTAEDLTADVFVRLLEALPRYRPGTAPFQAWLYRIARNLVTDWARRAALRNTDPLPTGLRDNGYSPATLVAQQLNSELLMEALQRLPQSQCDVLVLRFIAEMPIAEVALTLNKSESAVKALQARGLEALHRLLAHRMMSYEQTR